MTKHPLIVLWFVLMHLCTQAQVADSAKVSQTQIDIVYNHYIQDGDNSAVTGGIGTEQLVVYGPSINIVRKWGQNTLKFKGGADIISSASTDNINFVMSSASREDTRNYANIDYQRTSKNEQFSLYGGMQFSIESDYFSIGSRLGATKGTDDGLTQYSAEFQMYNDDLRWGRLDKGEWRPQTLVYPVELRDREWYDTYRRNSYNLKLGYTTAINHRMRFGIFPLLSYQKGILATPFHRIYFDDESKAVEQLPDQRFKTSIGLKLNQYIGNNLVLKNSINPYLDSWGILGISLQNETAIRLNQLWTLLPNARFYAQRGTSYFAPYGQHQTDDEYYTSDYDLADNQTYSVGIGGRFYPYTKLGKRSYINQMTLRYNYMYRSNGLTAHIMSLSIQLERVGNAKKKNRIRG